MLTFISEADVREHLTLEDSIDALDEAFRFLAAGRGEVVARRRLEVPNGLFHWMPASLEGAGVMGAKLYTTFGDQRESYIMLFDAHTGRLAAVVQSYHLSMIRTAAATALATRHLARRNAHTVCMIGTGSTAFMQVKGICAVRSVEEVRVFGRRAKQREQLAEALAADLVGVRVVAAHSAEQAVRGADIIVTSTNAATPILSLDWIAPGTHLNLIGSNFSHKREVGADLLLAAERVVADSLVSAREEAGDLVLAVSEGKFSWDRVDELSQVVAGIRPGRATEQGITVFKSVGVAIEDLAVASHLVHRLFARTSPVARQSSSSRGGEE